MGRVMTIDPEDVSTRTSEMSFHVSRPVFARLRAPCAPAPAGYGWDQ